MIKPPMRASNGHLGLAIGSVSWQAYWDRAREDDLRWEAELTALSEAAAGEHREGFIDGYLRAHADGEEYACSVKAAVIAHGKYLNDGGRALPRVDVEGC
jgi:hypothetical protein